MISLLSFSPFCLFVSLLFFWDRVSLHFSGSPETHYVVLALNSHNLPVTVSWVLGLNGRSHQLFSALRRERRHIFCGYQVLSSLILAKCIYLMKIDLSFLLSVVQALVFPIRYALAAVYATSEIVLTSQSEVISPWFNLKIWSHIQIHCTCWAWVQRPFRPALQAEAVSSLNV